MVYIFSFCLYGQEKKYTNGILENLRSIETYFPSFKAYIQVSTTVPEECLREMDRFPCAKVVPTDVDGAELMSHRFFPIDGPEVECIFVRDADSRITNRDIWCIGEFLQSPKRFHIIHDHYWHKTRITGGLWGMKKGLLQEKMEDLYDAWISNHGELRGQYDTDQKFLEQVIHPLIREDTLIHSNMIGFEGEDVQPIPEELFSEYHFMGNVYDENNLPVFAYSNFPLLDHMQWLKNQRQWGLLLQLTRNREISSIPVADRHTYLSIVCEAYLHTQDREGYQRIWRDYEWTHVTKEDLVVSDRYLQGCSVVATTDVTRQPSTGEEVVICYGSFPLDYRNLPHGNLMYRNAFFYPLCTTQTFEYHPCWERIKVIYILNLEHEVSRYIDILGELCRMGCPLDRVYHYKAKKEIVCGDRATDCYIGATKNHVDVMEHFVANFGPGDACLILEDDFVFTSCYGQNQRRLMEFWDRGYDFDICMLSASKYHDLRRYDDMLLLSYQECTTSSGYFLRRESAQAVLDCVREGYEKLYVTGDHGQYVIDRYWAKLQRRNKFFVMKDKIGYQRPNNSSTRDQFVCEFD